MDRAERRKRLGNPQSNCIRGIKDAPVVITSKEKEDMNVFMDRVEAHLPKMIVPAFYHTLLSVVLLNREEIIDDFLGGDDQALHCHIKVLTQYQDQTCEEETMIDVKWSVQAPARHANYFEAIIQLRDITDEQENIIHEMLAQHKLKVAKRVPLKKHGCDLYVDDTHRAQSCMKAVKKRLGGTTLVTTRLHGCDSLTSKLQYRVTILYKPEKKEILE